MGNNTSYMLGCADVSVRNSKHAYISREDFSAALRRNDSYTFFASQRQGKARDFADALERCHDTFMEGAPDDDGQLMHDGFIQIFGLRADEYTHRLVRIFDLDNSGAIGFREFVYGLSKFQTDTFERRVQFAYRLFDLDGDGSLDKHELTKAMRAALDADCAQYDLRPEQQTVKLPMRARVKPYNPTVMGKPSELQEEVERMARNMGKRTMGIDEFRLLVGRFPQIFQPPEVLYRLMHLYSRDAAAVISHLPPPQVKRLMEGLGRWQVDGSGATGFMDRSESGPKYRVSAGLGGGNDRSRFPLDTGAGRRRISVDIGARGSRSRREPSANARPTLGDDFDETLGVRDVYPAQPRGGARVRRVRYDATGRPRGGFSFAFAVVVVAVVVDVAFVLARARDTPRGGAATASQRVPRRRGGHAAV